MQCNLYAIDMDRRNKNCYICEGFDYLAQNYRRQNIGQKRKVKYENNKNYEQNNLNGERDLMVID